MQARSAQEYAEQLARENVEDPTGTRYTLLHDPHNLIEGTDYVLGFVATNLSNFERF